MIKKCEKCGNDISIPYTVWCAWCLAKASNEEWLHLLYGPIDSNELLESQGEEEEDGDDDD